MSINEEFYETYGVWDGMINIHTCTLYHKTKITIIGYRSQTFNKDISKISVVGPERIVGKLPKAYWSTSPIVLKHEWRYIINHRIANSLLIANELRNIIACYVL